MLAALAAVTIGINAPPMETRPEETDARGNAEVFSREDRGSFSVFVKDAGKEWSQVPQVEEKVESPCTVDWLVFHTLMPNVDFVLRTFRNQEEELAARRSTDDLTNYFEDDGFADNNFGLHDIY
jgi:hypothetical protein